MNNVNFRIPQVSVLRSDLCVSKLHDGKLYNTINYYTNEIYNDPGNHIFYYKRCLAFSRALRYIEAIEDIDKVIFLKPSFGDAYFQKGKILHKIGKPLSEITTCYENGLQVDPQHSEMKEMFLEQKYNLKINEEWISLHKKIENDVRMTLYYDSYGLYLMSTILFLQASDKTNLFFDENLKMSLCVLYGANVDIETPPKNIICLIGYASCYFRNRNYEKCIEFCKKAVKLCQKKKVEWEYFVKALYMIGNAYKEMGNQDEADIYYRKANEKIRIKNQRIYLKTNVLRDNRITSQIICVKKCEMYFKNFIWYRSFLRDTRLFRFLRFRSS